MKERTIMIFPQFDNIEKINEIRCKYDPLSDLVRPHITLVFPFKNEITSEYLSEQIRVCIHIDSFTLSKITVYQNLIRHFHYRLWYTDL